MAEKETRVYTVPLKKIWVLPKYKRGPKAVRVVREFVQKHMGATTVNIAPELNELIWKRGIGHPPRRLVISVEKDEEGVATVSLAE